MDGERLILDSGDTTTFSARTRHNWRNPLDTETEVLW
ncbi:MAG: cupin domain-containing protein, partial [Ramlibacter sp.]|nr:cupin domain-containing protein [Cryobacterium sp.]